jgi:hypothetical protein
MQNTSKKAVTVFAVVLMVAAFSLLLRTGASDASFVMVHVGTPAPTAVEVERGKCNAISTSDDGVSLVAQAVCGAVPGKRLAKFVCDKDPQPPAIEFELVAGDSSVVKFVNVCASQIKAL